MFDYCVISVSRIDSFRNIFNLDETESVSCNGLTILCIAFIHEILSYKGIYSLECLVWDKCVFAQVLNVLYFELVYKKRKNSGRKKPC